MMPPISVLNHVHWVDKIKIDIYPLIVEGESNQVVKIYFYAEGEVHKKFEVCAFTNHKFIEMKAEVKKNLTTILINKKEGKDGRNNKKG